MSLLQCILFMFFFVLMKYEKFESEDLIIIYKKYI